MEAPRLRHVRLPLSSSAETHYATQSTILIGSIGDAEDPDSLTVSWTSSLDGVLEGEFNTPDSSGTSHRRYTPIVGRRTSTHLEVLDSTGKNARDVVAITVLAENTNPTCGIEFPSDGDTRYPANAPVALSATVFDPETPLESLSLSHGAVM